MPGIACLALLMFYSAKFNVFLICPTRLYAVAYVY
jgi:hypothetical protein